MRYLLVAIENSNISMDRLYTYSWDGEVSVGDAVTVPFGGGNRGRKGYVFAVTDTTEVPTDRIKGITRREGPALSEEEVKLCCFMKEKYLCRYIDAVKCFLPSGNSRFEEYLTPADEDRCRAFAEDPKSPRRQAELISILIQHGSCPKSVLKKNFGIDYSVMKAVVGKGLAIQGRSEKLRSPLKSVKPEKEGFDRLTDEQEKAFGSIVDAMDGGKFKGFLVHGVTGSGKTRLYMECVRESLRRGRTAIVLVPEISLTVQVVERFRGEFGYDSVAVLHSKLSDGERYDEYMRIKRGQAKIVLGARSALFAPVENPGVIILDEEHETSYKADNSPKYDAREVAEEKAVINDAVLILGSATPSVGTYYRSEIGELTRLELHKRYNEVQLPHFCIADMRDELKKGNRSIFSIRLYNEMKNCLENGRQVILFLNRRGYSSFISCRECGHVMKCPECEVSLTYHKSGRAAVCHYCGRRMPLPDKCPECGSRYIKDFGTGTEKVEEMTRKLFPEAAVARLDLDTSRNKGSAEKILSDFKEKRTDILIGTQLVAKGLDFEAVDLVGIVAADISLNIPDYRSAERTYQLITQAGGRAGRGTKRGTVVVQTYTPDHYALTCAAENDYIGFYKREIHLRRAMAYPPYGKMIQLTFLNEDRVLCEQCALDFCNEITEKYPEETKNRLLGPTLTHIAKIGGRYRYQVLIKYSNGETGEFIDALDEIRVRFASSNHRKTSIGIDIDPYSLG